MALRTKITENGIDGSMVLEYARLPEDELAQISKELFDSLVDRIKLKGVLRKVNASSSTSASATARVVAVAGSRFRSTSASDRAGSRSATCGKGSFATVYRATYSLRRRPDGRRGLQAHRSRTSHRTRAMSLQSSVSSS